MSLVRWGCVIVAISITVVSCPARAEPIWTIGVFDDSYWEFDKSVQDDPEIVDYTIGDPFEDFPYGIGTDIGPQDSVINIHFSGIFDLPSRFTIRWSPGNSSIEQFGIAWDGTHIANSEARQGTFPHVWTTDTFDLPPVPGSDHTLTLTHLSGDGAWSDALQLDPVPEPSTVCLLILGGLTFLACSLRRRIRPAAAGMLLGVATAASPTKLI